VRPSSPRPFPSPRSVPLTRSPSVHLSQVNRRRAQRGERDAGRRRDRMAHIVIFVAPASARTESSARLGSLSCFRKEPRLLPLTGEIPFDGFSAVTRVASKPRLNLREERQFAVLTQPEERAARETERLAELRDGIAASSSNELRVACGFRASDRRDLPAAGGTKAPLL